MGRFVSRDPLGLWGDPGQRGVEQGYCGGNPVNRLDPTGEGWVDLIVRGVNLVLGALETKDRVDTTGGIDEVVEERSRYDENLERYAGPRKICRSEAQRKFKVEAAQSRARLGRTGYQRRGARILQDQVKKEIVGFSTGRGAAAGAGVGRGVGVASKRVARELNKRAARRAANSLNPAARSGLGHKPTPQSNQTLAAHFLVHVRKSVLTKVYDAENRIWTMVLWQGVPTANGGFVWTTSCRVNSPHLMELVKKINTPGPGGRYRRQRVDVLTGLHGDREGGTTLLGEGERMDLVLSDRAALDMGGGGGNVYDAGSIQQLREGMSRALDSSEGHTIMNWCHSSRTEAVIDGVLDTYSGG